MAGCRGRPRCCTHAPAPSESSRLVPRRPLPLHVARREPRLRRRPHEREQFERLLREYERFCGVRVLTFCILSRSALTPKRFRRHLKQFRAAGERAFLDRIFATMWDVSGYLQRLKQRFTRRRGRRGSYGRSASRASGWINSTGSDARNSMCSPIAVLSLGSPRPVGGEQREEIGKLSGVGSVEDGSDHRW